MSEYFYDYLLRQRTDTVGQTHRWTDTQLDDTQVDRHTGGRHAGGQTRRWTDTQVDRHAGGQTRRWTDTQVDRHAGGPTRRWTDTQVDRHAGGQTHRWTDTDRNDEKNNRRETSQFKPNGWSESPRHRHPTKTRPAGALISPSPSCEQQQLTSQTIREIEQSVNPQSVLQCDTTTQTGIHADTSRVTVENPA